MYTIFDSRFTKLLPHVHKLREAVSHARANEKPAAGSLLTSGWFIVWTHTANAATASKKRSVCEPVGMAN
jgi:hypothetical protein